LAARKSIQELEGDAPADLSEYADADSSRYAEMVQQTRKRLGLTSLRYQRLDDLIDAIGLPRDHVCTYCWNGVED
jgi:amidophosphoribosyltransferase